jgi:hypothetical protein
LKAIDGAVVYDLEIEMGTVMFKYNRKLKKQFNQIQKQIMNYPAAELRSIKMNF